MIALAALALRLLALLAALLLLLRQLQVLLGARVGVVALLAQQVRVVEDVQTRVERLALRAAATA